jgi:opacity protein-like surface antigen
MLGAAPNPEFVLNRRDINGNSSNRRTSMRKLMIAASAAALLATVSIAAAADVTGTIQSVDPSAGTVTLDNGQTFMLSSSLKSQAANWKIGDKVKVTYQGSGANMSATAVSPAS